LVLDSNLRSIRCRKNCAGAHFYTWLQFLCFSFHYDPSQSDTETSTFP